MPQKKDYMMNSRWFDRLVVPAVIAMFVALVPAAMAEQCPIPDDDQVHDQQSGNTGRDVTRDRYVNTPAGKKRLATLEEMRDMYKTKILESPARNIQVDGNYGVSKMQFAEMYADEVAFNYYKLKIWFRDSKLGKLDSKMRSFGDTPVGKGVGMAMLVVVAITSVATLVDTVENGDTRDITLFLIELTASIIVFAIISEIPVIGPIVDILMIGVIFVMGIVSFRKALNALNEQKASFRKLGEHVRDQVETLRTNLQELKQRINSKETLLKYDVEHVSYFGRNALHNTVVEAFNDMLEVVSMNKKQQLIGSHFKEPSDVYHCFSFRKEMLIEAGKKIQMVKESWERAGTVETDLCPLLNLYCNPARFDDLVDADMLKVNLDPPEPSDTGDRDIPAEHDQPPHPPLDADIVDSIIDDALAKASRSWMCQNATQYLRDDLHLANTFFPMSPQGSVPVMNTVTGIRPISPAARCDTRILATSEPGEGDVVSIDKTAGQGAPDQSGHMPTNGCQGVTEAGEGDVVSTTSDDAHEGADDDAPAGPTLAERLDLLEKDYALSFRGPLFTKVATTKNEFETAVSEIIATMEQETSSQEYYIPVQGGIIPMFRVDDSETGPRSLLSLDLEHNRWLAQWFEDHYLTLANTIIDKINTVDVLTERFRLQLTDPNLRESIAIEYDSRVTTDLAWLEVAKYLSSDLSILFPSEHSDEVKWKSVHYVFAGLLDATTTGNLRRIFGDVSEAQIIVNMIDHLSGRGISIYDAQAMDSTIQSLIEKIAGSGDNSHLMDAICDGIHHARQEVAPLLFGGPRRKSFVESDYTDRGDRNCGNDYIPNQKPLNPPVLPVTDEEIDEFKQQISQIDDLEQKIKDRFAADLKFGFPWLGLERSDADSPLVEMHDQRLRAAVLSAGYKKISDLIGAELESLVDNPNGYSVSGMFDLSDNITKLYQYLENRLIPGATHLDQNYGYYTYGRTLGVLPIVASAIAFLRNNAVSALENEWLELATQEELEKIRRELAVDSTVLSTYQDYLIASGQIHDQTDFDYQSDTPQQTVSWHTIGVSQPVSSDHDSGGLSAGLGRFQLVNDNSDYAVQLGICVGILRNLYDESTYATMVPFYVDDVMRGDKLVSKTQKIGHRQYVDYYSSSGSTKLKIVGSYLDDVNSSYGTRQRTTESDVTACYDNDRQANKINYWSLRDFTRPFYHDGSATRSDQNYRFIPSRQTISFRAAVGAGWGVFNEVLWSNASDINDVNRITRRDFIYTETYTPLWAGGSWGHPFAGIGFTCLYRDPENRSELLDCFKYRGEPDNTVDLSMAGWDIFQEEASLTNIWSLPGNFWREPKELYDHSYFRYMPYAASPGRRPKRDLFCTLKQQDEDYETLAFEAGSLEPYVSRFFMFSNIFDVGMPRDLDDRFRAYDQELISRRQISLLLDGFSYPDEYGDSPTRLRTDIEFGHDIDRSGLRTDARLDTKFYRLFNSAEYRRYLAGKTKSNGVCGARHYFEHMPQDKWDTLETWPYALEGEYITSDQEEYFVNYFEEIEENYMYSDSSGNNRIMRPEFFIYQDIARDAGFPSGAAYITGLVQTDDYSYLDNWTPGESYEEWNSNYLSQYSPISRYAYEQKVRYFVDPLIQQTLLAPAGEAMGQMLRAQGSTNIPKLAAYSSREGYRPTANIVLQAMRARSGSDVALIEDVQLVFEIDRAGLAWMNTNHVSEEHILSKNLIQQTDVTPKIRVYFQVFLDSQNEIAMQAFRGDNDQGHQVYVDFDVQESDFISFVTEDQTFEQESGPGENFTAGNEYLEWPRVNTQEAVDSYHMQQFLFVRDIGIQTLIGQMSSDGVPISRPIGDFYGSSSKNLLSVEVTGMELRHGDVLKYQFKTVVGSDLHTETSISRDTVWPLSSYHIYKLPGVVEARDEGINFFAKVEDDYNNHGTVLPETIDLLMGTNSTGLKAEPADNNLSVKAVDHTVATLRIPFNDITSHSSSLSLVDRLAIHDSSWSMVIDDPTIQALAELIEKGPVVADLLDDTRVISSVLNRHAQSDGVSHDVGSDFSHSVVQTLKDSLQRKRSRISGTPGESDSVWDVLPDVGDVCDGSDFVLNSASADVVQARRDAATYKIFSMDLPKVYRSSAVTRMTFHQPIDPAEWQRVRRWPALSTADCNSDKERLMSGPFSGGRGQLVSFVENSEARRVETQTRLVESLYANVHATIEQIESLVESVNDKIEAVHTSIEHANNFRSVLANSKLLALFNQYRELTKFADEAEQTDCSDLDQREHPACAFNIVAHVYRNKPPYIPGTPRGPSFENILGEYLDDTPVQSNEHLLEVLDILRVNILTAAADQISEIEEQVPGLSYLDQINGNIEELLNTLQSFEDFNTEYIKITDTIDEIGDDIENINLAHYNSIVELQARLAAILTSTEEPSAFASVHGDDNLLGRLNGTIEAATAIAPLIRKTDAFFDYLMVFGDEVRLDATRHDVEQIFTRAESRIDEILAQSDEIHAQNDRKDQIISAAVVSYSSIQDAQLTVNDAVAATQSLHSDLTDQILSDESSETSGEWISNLAQLKEAIGLDAVKLLYSWHFEDAVRSLIDDLEIEIRQSFDTLATRGEYGSVRTVHDVSSLRKYRDRLWYFAVPSDLSVYQTDHGYGKWLENKSEEENYQQYINEYLMMTYDGVETATIEMAEFASALIDELQTLNALEVSINQFVRQYLEYWNRPGKDDADAGAGAGAGAQDLATGAYSTSSPDHVNPIPAAISVVVSRSGDYLSDLETTDLKRQDVLLSAEEVIDVSSIHPSNADEFESIISTFSVDDLGKLHQGRIESSYILSVAEEKVEIAERELSLINSTGIIFDIALKLGEFSSELLWAAQDNVISSLFGDEIITDAFDGFGSALYSANVGENASDRMKFVKLVLASQIANLNARLAVLDHDMVTDVQELAQRLEHACRTYKCETVSAALLYDVPSTEQFTPTMLTEVLAVDLGRFHSPVWHAFAAVDIFNRRIDVLLDMLERGVLADENSEIANYLTDIISQKDYSTSYVQAYVNSLTMMEGQAAALSGMRETAANTVNLISGDDGLVAQTARQQVQMSPQGDTVDTATQALDVALHYIAPGGMMRDTLKTMRDTSHTARGGDSDALAMLGIAEDLPSDQLEQAISHALELVENQILIVSHALDQAFDEKEQTDQDHQSQNPIVSLWNTLDSHDENVQEIGKSYDDLVFYDLVAAELVDSKDADKIETIVYGAVGASNAARNVLWAARNMMLVLDSEASVIRSQRAKTQIFQIFGPSPTETLFDQATSIYVDYSNDMVVYVDSRSGMPIDMSILEESQNLDIQSQELFERRDVASGKIESLTATVDELNSWVTSLKTDWTDHSSDFYMHMTYSAYTDFLQSLTSNDNSDIELLLVSASEEYLNSVMEKNPLTIERDFYITHTIDNVLLPKLEEVETFGQQSRDIITGFIDTINNSVLPRSSDGE